MPVPSQISSLFPNLKILLVSKPRIDDDACRALSGLSFLTYLDLDTSTLRAGDLSVICQNMHLLNGIQFWVNREEDLSAADAEAISQCCSQIEDLNIIDTPNAQHIEADRPCVQFMKHLKLPKLRSLLLPSCFMKGEEENRGRGVFVVLLIDDFLLLFTDQNLLLLTRFTTLQRIDLPRAQKSDWPHTTSLTSLATSHTVAMVSSFVCFFAW